jgi:SAM-dependent methyltransferase
MTHYTKKQFATKQLFVDRVIREFRPCSILDVGCNTGFFSFLAAKSGARVVAIDSDPVVIGDVWRGARRDHLDVLPLIVDLARPTPAVGWRNRECSDFLERARDAFDAVLMLAVIHHMLVNERIPLVEIVDLAADLTRDLAVLEFVSPDDPMFKRLTRGRDELFTGLTTAVFESTCRRRFEIVRSQKIEHSDRHLYLLRKIPGASCA